LALQPQYPLQHLPGSAFHLVFLAESARLEAIRFFNGWLTSLLRQMVGRID
jgi:hypothetical protein